MVHCLTCTSAGVLLKSLSSTGFGVSLWHPQSSERPLKGSNRVWPILLGSGLPSNDLAATCPKAKADRSRFTASAQLCRTVQKITVRANLFAVQDS